MVTFAVSPELAAGGLNLRLERGRRSKTAVRLSSSVKIRPGPDDKVSMRKKAGPGAAAYMRGMIPWPRA